MMEHLLRGIPGDPELDLDDFVDGLFDTILLGRVTIDFVRGSFLSIDEGMKMPELHACFASVQCGQLRQEESIQRRHRMH